MSYYFNFVKPVKIATEANISAEMFVAQCEIEEFLNSTGGKFMRAVLERALVNEHIALRGFRDLSNTADASDAMIAQGRIDLIQTLLEEGFGMVEPLKREIGKRDKDIG